MTKILIRILFLASVVVGGVLFSKQKQIVQNPETINDFEDKKEQFQGSIKGITDNISSQTQELTTRGQEVSDHMSNILGAYIKPTDSVTNNSNDDNSDENSSSSENNSTNEIDKPIYEETLDYGRYLYCQQVIEDYEVRQKNN